MKNVFKYTGQPLESIPVDITHVRDASYVEMIDGHTFGHCSELVNVELNDGLKTLVLNHSLTANH